MPCIPAVTHWLRGVIGASGSGRNHMNDTSESANNGDDDHLSELQDGCGCTEVWEHLSEHRNEDDG